MHFFSATVLGLLGLSSLAAAAPSDVFHRAEHLRGVLEKRVPDQPFQNERLQKRASPFLNSKTKKFEVDGKFRRNNGLM